MSQPKQNGFRGDEALRAAFQAQQAESEHREACPSAGDLWSAVRGELSGEERRVIVFHTSLCGACAAAWRLGMDVTPDPIPDRIQAPPSAFARRPWPRTFAPLAAAAALILTLAGGWWLWRPPVQIGTPGFRGHETRVIRSLTSEDQALPRDDFHLRWSAGPEGSHYDVRVTTESLDVLASAQRLAEPSFLVPEPALAPLPPDSRILWRVEAVLPDGDRVASPTFVTRLR